MGVEPIPNKAASSPRDSLDHDSLLVVPSGSGSETVCGHRRWSGCNRATLWPASPAMPGASSTLLTLMVTLMLSSSRRCCRLRSGPLLSRT